MLLYMSWLRNVILTYSCKSLLKKKKPVVVLFVLRSALVVYYHLTSQIQISLFVSFEITCAKQILHGKKQLFDRTTCLPSQRY